MKGAKYLQGKVMYMRFKGLWIAVVLLLSVVVSGCAKPDEELLQMENGAEPSVQNSAKNGNDPQQQDSIEKGTNAAVDVHADNQRVIKEVYGDEEFSFKIDATVVVPDAQIRTGTLSDKALDISLIEELLTGGVKLHPREIKSSEDGATEIRYVSDSNETGTYLDYDISYAPMSKGMALYDNWKLDKYFVGFEMVITNTAERTPKQITFVKKMQSQGMEVFDKLGLETELAPYERLFISEQNDICYIPLNMMLDKFSLISKEYQTYVESSVNIAEQGINGIHFEGLYEMAEAHEVSIISLDETLAIIEKGVKDKSINTYDEIIGDVRLAYMVDDTKEVPEFYPVWCFSMRYDNDMPYLPVLCINAQTGAIDCMS